MIHTQIQQIRCDPVSISRRIRILKAPRICYDSRIKQLCCHRRWFQSHRLEQLVDDLGARCFTAVDIIVIAESFFCKILRCQMMIDANGAPAALVRLFSLIQSALIAAVHTDAKIRSAEILHILYAAAGIQKTEIFRSILF